MAASDLTLAIAFGAGLLSFLSPCVLPLVPAYLGQVTVAAVVGRSDGTPSRWLALRHAIAYVLGFGTIFTLLGVTATYVGGPLADYLPVLRTVGGVLLVILGLNLAGILPIPILDRTWRPLEAGAAGALADRSGTTAFTPAGPQRGIGVGRRIGGRLAGGHGGLLASFGLGVVFAVGWTPCIGAILGSILMVAATSGTVAKGGVLLFAFTMGLGVPFIALGAIYDRAPAMVRPLVRHGRAVSFVGGILVAVIGIFMIMDWLTWISRLVPFSV